LAVLEFGPADRPYDLLFLHANGFNALTYRRVLAPLADRYRILAADQRGHGATTLPTVTEGRDGWGDFRDDFLALLEILDVRDAVLAGHSMGGTTCLGAAARTSGRARNLVLFDPVILSPEGLALAKAGGMPHSPLIDGARRRRGEFPTRQAVIETYRQRRAFATWSDDMLVDYVEDGFRDLPGGGVRLACEPAWEASTYEAQDNDPWADFAAVRAPIAILKAEIESTCRIDAAEARFTAERGVQIETVPRTSHFLPMERPELATERLALALQR
jgi:pimeloyl-ACP methyl ester carboxylesterase